MIEEELLKNLKELKVRMNNAGQNVGRKIDEVKLIAVSKNHSVENIRFFKEQGLTIFGESRVQDLFKKAKEIAEVEWHYIGHLQRNKVKKLISIDNCMMIQSLDSWRLAVEIDKQARKNKRVIPVLLEVNIANDKNKYGIATEEIFDFIEAGQDLNNIDFKGLMTIAPYVENPEEVRPYFRRLAKFKQQLINKGYKLTELSMGMTNDFEVAIEEGATMVRVGTGLFGKREGY